MKQSKPFIALLCVLLMAAPGLYSQQLIDRGPTVSDQNAHWYSGFTKPYKSRYVPPINLSNSGRADSLIRAGNLYLSLADAIAMALENNIDVEVSRYGYLTSESAYRSSLAGGNGVPNLDPVLGSTIQWGHTTSVNSNAITTGGQTSVVGSNKVANFNLNQGFITGGSATLNFNNSISDTNNPGNTYNPNTNANTGLQFTQPLLSGFGLALNRRFIRIAKNNLRVTDYTFEQQLNTTLNTLISTYWNLVSSALAVDVAQQTLDEANHLLSDNKKQLDIGTMAPLDVLQAQQQVSTSETSLIRAQTAVEQLEVSLKNLISRNGLANTSLADVHIIPTDRITVPAVEPIQPVQDVVAKALDHRPELGQQRLQLENSKISLTGTRNAMLPQLNFVTNLSQPATGGPVSTFTTVNPLTGQPNVHVGNPDFTGGYGNILSQLFGRNTLSYSFAAQLTIPLRNRSAQEAYVQAGLNLRTQELGVQKEVNQIRMDVQNALIAVKNARATYQSATTASAVAQQVLDAEQKKYELGASTSYAVVQHQVDLANARQTEVSAISAYAQAKLQLDQAAGTILENNNVVIDEVKNGRMSKAPSRIPDVPPPAATTPGRAAIAAPVVTPPVANR
jgi:outer membrane protein TolC